MDDSNITIGIPSEFDSYEVSNWFINRLIVLVVGIISHVSVNNRPKTTE